MLHLYTHGSSLIKSLVIVTGICSSNVFSQPGSMYKPSEPKIRRIHITSQPAPTPTESNHSAGLMGQGMRLASSTALSISSSSSTSLSTSSITTAASGRQAMHQHQNQHPHQPQAATSNSHHSVFIHNQKVVSVDYQGKALPVS